MTVDEALDILDAEYRPSHEEKAVATLRRYVEQVREELEALKGEAAGIINDSHDAKHTVRAIDRLIARLDPAREEQSD